MTVEKKVDMMVGKMDVYLVETKVERMAEMKVPLLAAKMASHLVAKMAAL